MVSFASVKPKALLNTENKALWVRFISCNVGIKHFQGRITFTNGLMIILERVISNESLTEIPFFNSIVYL